MEKVASNRRAGREPAEAAQSGSEQTAVPSDLVSSRILRLSNILRRSSTLVYNRRFGLSQIEWRILALVGEQAPISLNALAELMALDKGQVSRGVSALVVRRLLLREYRREGRGVAITLATHGAEVYRELMESALERNNVLLQGMTAAERMQLFGLLERLTVIARGILDREQGA